MGWSGGEGGLLTARRWAAGLGQVGEITAVRAALLESLLLAGLTPVVAPVAPAAGGEGVPLNVNADHAAAAIAAALRAKELLYVSDVPGVVIDGVAQDSVAASDIPALIELGVATDGMAAKLRAGAAAPRTRAQAG